MVLGGGPAELFLTAVLQTPPVAAVALTSGSLWSMERSGESRSWVELTPGSSRVPVRQGNQQLLK